jgi:uncharacterized protein (TIGR02452 family)
MTHIHKEHPMNLPTALNLPTLTLDELLMPPHVAAATGPDTQHITEQGWYTNPQGQKVDIRALRDAATDGTVTYRPGITPPVGASQHARVHTFMHNQTTLAVAEARVAQGYRVAILNFASATSPGGGWLDGARAQEESLARSSTLVHALRDDDMYQNETHRRNPFYDDTVIVTLGVPFFRHHNGQFLDSPWQGDVITSAAVQANAVQTYMPERVGEIRATMRQRTQKVFQVATTLDAHILILGAWGCGAFGNDPEAIAQMMLDTMQLVDMRRFVAIDFAVADVKDALENYPAFATRFDGKVFGG